MRATPVAAGRRWCLLPSTLGAAGCSTQRSLGLRSNRPCRFQCMGSSGNCVLGSCKPEHSYKPTRCTVRNCTSRCHKVQTERFLIAPHLPRTARKEPTCARQGGQGPPVPPAPPPHRLTVCHQAVQGTGQPHGLRWNHKQCLVLKHLCKVLAYGIVAAPTQASLPDIGLRSGGFQNLSGQPFSNGLPRGTGHSTWQ